MTYRPVSWLGTLARCDLSVRLSALVVYLAHISVAFLECSASFLAPPLSPPYLAFKSPLHATAAIRSSDCPLLCKIPLLLVAADPSVFVAIFLHVLYYVINITKEQRNVGSPPIHPLFISNRAASITSNKT